MSFRLDRLNREIQKILSVAIKENLGNPKISKLSFSVTGVITAKDLKTAKVYVGIGGGNGEEKAAGFSALCSSAGFLRRFLSETLRDMRTVPELRFVLDESSEYGIKIDAILNSLKSGGDYGGK
jgi:ribosome-binding factor A